MVRWEAVAVAFELKIFIKQILPIVSGGSSLEIVTVTTFLRLRSRLTYIRFQLRYDV